MPKGKRTSASFTHKTAKLAQIKSAAARQKRAQLRDALIADNAEDLRAMMREAITNRDADLLEIVTKSVQLVGADFRASPEFVQKLDVDATEKVDHALNIKFFTAGAEKE